MATLNIEGRTVNVDDSFLKLSPDEQNATVDEIHQSLTGGAAQPAFDRADPRFTEGALASGKALEGVPFLPNDLISKAGAAVSAAAHPLTGVGSDGGSFSDRYAKNFSQEKAASDTFQQEHPVESGVAKAIGGTLAMAPAMAMAPAAFGLTGPTVAGRIAAGAASGAAIGGGDAAIKGENPAAGAVTGLVAGAAGPAIGKVVGAGYQALRGGAPEIAESASPQVARALKSDNLDAASAQAKLAELGPDATLADIGPNLRSQTEALAATPGPAQKIVVDAMKDRAAGAGDRISAALDQHLGPEVNPTELAEQIVARRKAQAAPLYDAAYKTPISTNDDIEGVLGTPIGKIALQKAAMLAKSEPDVPLGMFGPKPSKAASMPAKMSAAEYQDWLSANAAGQPAERSVDVRGLDLTKRALDDMHDQAQRSGANNRARVINGLRTKLTGAIDQQAPIYPQARDVFSTESGIKDALENGRNLFSKAMSPDELGASLRGMTAAERDAFTQGTRSAVSDIMGSARNDAGAARTLFAKGWTKEKLDQVLGPQTTEALLGHMEREATFHETSSGVLGNSRTAARLAAQSEFPSIVKDPQVRHGLTPLDLAAYVPRKIVGAVIGNKMRERAAKVGTDAAKALTATGPARDEIVRKLLEKQLAQTTDSARRVQLERMIATTVRGALPANVNR